MLTVLGSFFHCLIHFTFNKYSLRTFDILSACWGYNGGQVHVFMNPCPVRETAAIQISSCIIFATLSQEHFKKIMKISQLLEKVMLTFEDLNPK